MATLAPSARSDNFAARALPYVKAGASVLPCGEADGKTPRVKGWTKRKPGPKTVREWGQRWPDANVGVATALSGITVVDVDTYNGGNPNHWIARCGDTPVVAKTPRGGVHLYYRYAGEQTITGLEQGIDIKADRNGLVIAPPSRNFETGGVYSWLKGGPEILAKLPHAKPSSLPLRRAQRPSPAPTDIPLGRRNNTLFECAMRRAVDAENEHHLRLMVEMEAEACKEPLPDAELDKIAASAWRYEEQGLNRFGREARVEINLTTFNALLDDPHANTLLQFLLTKHGSRTEPWVFVVHRVWDADLLRGWGRDTIRKAFGVLLDRGFVECVHRGRGKGNPNKYRLAV